MSVNYASYPKVTITYPTTNLSYVTITYYGNTTATSSTVSSGVHSSGTYTTTTDLSFNTLYTFTVTPYNSAGSAGTAKVITVNTTPNVTGAYASNSTASNTQLQWYGTYSYVKIYRKTASTSYVDVSSGWNITSMPYYDKDLCGNTTYTYYIQPYASDGTAYTASNTVAITTNVQAAKDLSSVFYDFSSIKLSFTLPKNSYSSSYYYTLRAIDSSLGYTKDVSGTTSPLFVLDLSSGTTYTCYVLTYLDGALGATSSGYSVTTSSAATTTSYQYYYISYVGSDISLVIPTYATSMTVQLWGAGGGSAGTGSYAAYQPAYGGGGGYTEGVFSVSSYAGKTLRVIVGGGGASVSAYYTTSSSYGGGGCGYGVNNDATWGFSAGGGRTAVQLNTSGSTYTEIITAGGGGGGGISTGSSSVNYGCGGAGGGSVGGNATEFSAEGGDGGTASAGGSGGTTNNSNSFSNGASGTPYTGGSAYTKTYGSGGGGGYYGGGSGSIYYNGGSFYFGGGGGGSSYVNTTYGTQTTMTQASGNVVAYNAGLPSSLQQTIGNGGARPNYGGSSGSSKAGTSGQNGYAIIKFTVATPL